MIDFLFFDLMMIYSNSHIGKDKNEKIKFDLLGYAQKTR